MQARFEKGLKTEMYAWERAQEQYEAQCPHDTAGNILPSSKALESIECYEKVVRRAVAPVVVDLVSFNDLMVTYNKIGLSRKMKKIDVDEARIACTEAWNIYTKTVTSKANALLQQANLRDQQTLRQMQSYSQQQSMQAQQCDALDIAPMASLGCKNICINGRWSEVCG